MPELIISEKPSQAAKIAEALADDKPKRKTTNRVSYYELIHKGRKIFVGCAVGHLFNLKEKEKQGWTYPVFSTTWCPAYELSKTADFTKKYIDTLTELARKADRFIVACDYDLEGSLIGYNVLRFIANKRDGRRMRFSTLTKTELQESYKKASKHLDFPLIRSGETRHIVDYLWGINLSRALTLAVKNATRVFKILSSGRVQGPALKILADREKEIQRFQSKPFWELEAHGDVYAKHKKDKFWDKKQVKQIYQKIKDARKAIVQKITKRIQQQSPPHPFDLTSLQLEAYRVFKILPKETLAIAQRLYTKAYISYPRTSSNQFPPQLNMRNIIQKLSKQNLYTQLCAQLLSKPKLVPNNGRKVDAAHPAVYSTGIQPKNLNERARKIYDLIVRRTLATFGDPAKRESITINLEIKKEPFIAKGIRTIEPGWHIFYGRYAKFDEISLPQLNQGDLIKIKKINLLSKETQPPKRYTPASIIKELENKNLGTKCLTENTFVKINLGDNVHTEKISNMFENLPNKFLVSDKGENIELALNNKKHCFSFDGGNEKRSIFGLVSRRKLKEEEKVYHIRYVDGSYIDATQEHPLLIFKNKSIKYVSASNLKKGMKSVTSIRFPEKTGDVLFNWKDFIQKCQPNTKIYAVSEDLINTRKQQNLTQKEFGKKYGFVQSEICRYEKLKFVHISMFSEVDLPKPRYLFSVNRTLLIKNPFPLEMNSSLARILGNLVGDCSIDLEKIKKENCYDFRYHNTNPDLINRFIGDIRKIFGVKLNIRQAKPKPNHLPKYYVRIPALIGRILFTLFPQIIEKNATHIPKTFYREFVGALFDDEGHTTKNEPKLFISNTNFKLLEELQSMLAILNINSILDRGQFKLYIRGRDNLEKFLEAIPIHSMEKRQRLIDHLSRFYKFGTGLSSIKKQFYIVSVLNQSKNKELTNKEISDKLNFDPPRTMHHLKILIHKGYIERIVTGISEYPRKKISYKLIRPVEETFFKYIDERIISPDFITKTIQSVKPIRYKGLVYDITNRENLPNFILSNGVVVHNSTRASIIDALYQRDYISGTSMQVTNLGLKTVQTLKKYCPEILDEEMTRKLETDMEEIREKKETKETVLQKAKRHLKKTLKHFKENEPHIGRELGKATIETRQQESKIGQCPECKKGTLRLTKGRFGLFIACDRYKEGCKTTFSIPSNSLARPTKNTCKDCGYPEILIIRKGKKPQLVCLNLNCKTKRVPRKLLEKKRKCPKCGSQLIVKKSLYGAFFSCPKYPKCRYIEPIQNSKNKNNKKNGAKVRK